MAYREKVKSIFYKSTHPSLDHRMTSAANTRCARSRSGLGYLLYLAQSGALDHGLTVRTSADVLDLLNFSNCGVG